LVTRNFIYDVEYVFPLFLHGLAAAIAGAIVLAALAKSKEEPATSVMNSNR
jgi:hypothetical protein